MFNRIKAKPWLLSWFSQIIKLKSYFFQPVKNVRVLLLNKTVYALYINFLEIKETVEPVSGHQMEVYE